MVSFAAGLAVLTTGLILSAIGTAILARRSLAKAYTLKRVNTIIDRNSIDNPKFSSTRSERRRSSITG
jgi:hypothetical protein